MSFLLLLQMDCICSDQDRLEVIMTPKIFVALHTFQQLTSQVQLEVLVCPAPCYITICLHLVVFSIRKLWDIQWSMVVRFSCTLL